jgi:hypothetical protein
MVGRVSDFLGFAFTSRIPISGGCGRSWVGWAVRPGRLGGPRRRWGGGLAEGNGPARLDQNGRRLGFWFKWNLSGVLSGFWSNEIYEDF